MADHEIKRTANIGSSFLILIFIVICLVTFCLLSISNAQRENLFSEKNAAAVKEYYRADSQGVDFLTAINDKLQNTVENDMEKTKAAVLEAFGAYYEADSNTFCTDVDMAAGQALRIELKADWEEKICHVTAWNVYQKEQYEIDQSVPVWSGQ